jgi:hypothetical protein
MTEEEALLEQFHRLGTDGKAWADEFCLEYYAVKAGDLDDGTAERWFRAAIAAGAKQGRREAEASISRLQKELEESKALEGWK